MKIAISTDGSQVSAHFGRCPSFTAISVENGELKQKEELSNPGHSPGAIPEFLHGHGVDTIVAGGMGQRAQIIFDEYGIQTIVGVSGNIEDVISQLCAGTLTGGESSCNPGAGKGYGIEKEECDHDDHEEE